MESFTRSISRIPITPRGEAGPKEHAVSVGVVLNGLAFDAELTPDEAGHLTNSGFSGTTLFTVN